MAGRITGTHSNRITHVSLWGRAKGILMMGSDDKGADPIMEAVCWFIGLEDAPKDEVMRADFILWLHAHSENAAAWANSSGMYDVMATPPREHVDDWAPHTPATQKSLEQRMSAAISPSPNWKLRVAMGVIAALAACVAFLMVPSFLLLKEADYMTSKAEVRPIMLEDGSMLLLAAESAITIEYTAAERRLRLLKGEAFIHAVMDRERPFRVTAGNLTTMALGTTFNVHLGEVLTTVSVRHGLLDVAYGAAPSASVSLELGDWVDVDGGGNVQRGHTRYQEVGLWSEDMLYGRDRLLKDVVDDLRRYIPGAIILTGSGLANQRVSGVYKFDDPIAALRAIVSAHGGSVHHVLPWVLLVTGD